MFHQYLLLFLNARLMCHAIQMLTHVMHFIDKKEVTDDHRKLHVDYIWTSVLQESWLFPPQ